MSDWFENPNQKELALKMSATPNQQQNAMMQTAMAFGLNSTADKQRHMQPSVAVNTDAEDFAKDIQNRV